MKYESCIGKTTLVMSKTNCWSYEAVGEVGLVTVPMIRSPTTSIRVASTTKVSARPIKIRLFACTQALEGMQRKAIQSVEELVLVYK